jgi:predicted NBD/HSP70 family sugar kinase
MQEKADSALIKKLNEIRLLNLIREEGPISRNLLAKRSRISKVAVSDIINRLNEAGYILEIGKGESTRRGGKRPTMIKLNAENGYVLGLEVKRWTTNIALANIESEVKGVAQLTYKAGISIEDFFPAVFRKIDELLETHQIPAGKLIGIAIGIPGFVDYQTGQLIFADTLRGWANLPLGERFTHRYKAPTIVENDVNTLALGESLLGVGRGNPNLVCIWIGDGIGSGIIVDGQLVRGETGNAGEVGYLEIDQMLGVIPRIPKLFRQQRFLGDVISETNLFEVLLREGSPKEPAEVEFSPQRLREMLASGELGNPRVREILDEYALLVAIPSIIFIKTLNPSLIVLSGRVFEASSYLFDKVRELVQKSMQNIPFKSGSLVLSHLKEEAALKGAIVLALQTIFEPPVKKSKNLIRIQP